MISESDHFIVIGTRHHALFHALNLLGLPLLAVVLSNLPHEPVPLPFEPPPLQHANYFIHEFMLAELPHCSCDQSRIASLHDVLKETQVAQFD
jgi:hypothetical protein